MQASFLDTCLLLPDQIDASAVILHALPRATTMARTGRQTIPGDIQDDSMCQLWHDGSLRMLLQCLLWLHDHVWHWWVLKCLASHLKNNCGMQTVDPLAQIVHRDAAYRVGKALTVRLREVIPRQQFRIPIQAAIGVKVVASENLSGDPSAHPGPLTVAQLLPDHFEADMQVMASPMRCARPLSCEDWLR